MHAPGRLLTHRGALLAGDGRRATRTRGTDGARTEAAGHRTVRTTYEPRTTRSATGQHEVLGNSAVLCCETRGVAIYVVYVEVDSYIGGSHVRMLHVLGQEGRPTFNLESR